MKPKLPAGRDNTLVVGGADQDAPSLTMFASAGRSVALWRSNLALAWEDHEDTGQVARPM